MKDDGYLLVVACNVILIYPSSSVDSISYCIYRLCRSKCTLNIRNIFICYYPNDK